MKKKTSADLKGLLIISLCDRVANGEVDPRSGERVDAPASTLNAAVNFLKQFPPEEMVVQTDNNLSDTLKKYTNVMPIKATH
jgi:hypothetical protein